MWNFVLKIPERAVYQLLWHLPGLHTDRKVERSDNDTPFIFFTLRTVIFLIFKDVLSLSCLYDTKLCLLFKPGIKTSLGAVSVWGGFIHPDFLGCELGLGDIFIVLKLRWDLGVLDEQFNGTRDCTLGLGYPHAYYTPASMVWQTFENEERVWIRYNQTSRMVVQDDVFL